MLHFHTVFWCLLSAFSQENKKSEKTFKKFKKSIDKYRKVLYNRQANLERGTANCSLKIEQHEISSTEKCRDLVNTL